MKKILQPVIFYFTLPILFFISLLPFCILYKISDTLYYLVYYIIRYRRKVVETNLKNSFPTKTKNELKIIERNFYKYFCDLAVEIIKTISIRKKTAIKRCSIDKKALELFEKLYYKRKSIILITPHLGNWELSGISASTLFKHQLYVIYRPLSNKYFNKLIVYMRTRCGTKLYTMKNTLRGIIKNKDEINITAFLADQTPPPKGAYWTKFLNQETPVFTGPEKIAKKFELPVVYFSILRIKRGYYSCSAEILFDDPKNTKPNEINETITRRIEKEILRTPETWLWSHKRWKHKK